MLMLLREERLIEAGEDDPATARAKNDDYNYLGNDEFFTKNYDLKFNKGSESRFD